MPFKDAIEYLRRVVPWDGSNYINIHRKKDAPNGASTVYGVPFTTVDSALIHLEYLQRTVQDTDVYLAMGSYREVEERTNTQGGKYRTAKRLTSNVFAHKALYMDLDVKLGQPDKAYASTKDALIALTAAIKSLSMPNPNVIVLSGTGGVHCYWTFTELLSTVDWQPRANAFVEAMRSQGVKFDTQCTVDGVRLLRVPETWNGKQTPRLPVQMRHCGPDQDWNPMDAALAPYFGKAASHPPVDRVTAM